MYLNILDPNQTVNFITPSYENDNLVRTGVISDGSCLIHCILFASSSKYRNSDIQTKKKIVSELRKSIADSITKDQFMELNNGEISKISFTELLQTELETMYNSNQSTPIEFFKSVVSKNEIDTIIQSNINRDLYFIGTSIILGIVELFKFKLSDQTKFSDKISKCCDIIKDTFESMISTCINNAYNNYCNGLSNPKEQLGHENLELLSKIFKFNLCFINGETRKPYEFGSLDLFYNESIVILWIENHFEIIGRVDDKTIQRKFGKEDEFIQIFTKKSNIEIF